MTDDTKRCDPDCPRKASGTCYSHHGCRCDVCKAANARRCDKRRRQRNPLMLSPEQHGKKSSYSNWNCRCDKCTTAWNEYQLGRYHDNEELREYYKKKSREHYQAKKEAE